MRKIDRLRLSALQSCKARGHVMGRFTYTRRRKFPAGWNASGLATCKVCGAYVGIDSNPWPNGIDIGGPAVAIECEGDKP